MSQTGEKDAHTHTHARTDTHTHMRTHKTHDTRAGTHTHARTHTHADMHADMHATHALNKHANPLRFRGSISASASSSLIVVGSHSCTSMEHTRLAGAALPPSGLFPDPALPPVKIKIEQMN